MFHDRTDPAERLRFSRNTMRQVVRTVHHSVLSVCRDDSVHLEHECDDRNDGRGGVKRKKPRNYSLDIKRAVCANCGEKGPHFVPPSLGDPGIYICKAKESVS